MPDAHADAKLPGRSLPAAASGDDYDHLPYISMPIVHTQPSRLAALAQIFGLEAPPADRASVLELGCASGGNIIPLAARFPNARFLGLDLSRQHVRDGLGRIAQLGLGNIEIRQGDLATVDLGEARFDYVICHGVFSWVPPVAQEAILRICGRHLADHGVATISYNVLPGWHLRQVVRDICLSHAGSGRPHERVARARAILQRVATSSGTAAPYGHLVVAEAKRLARMPASYILGEFLAAFNAPCTFVEFAGRAQRHGLSYVCEGDVPSSSVAQMAPKAAGAIRELAGDDPAKAQHYLDSFTGRTFRRSVLVRSGAVRNGTAGPATERLTGLHFAGVFRPDEKSPAAGVKSFIDHSGKRIRTRSAAAAGMMATLGQRYPATVSLADLIAVDAGSEPRIRADLVKLIVNGRVNISSLPLLAGTPQESRPVAWPLARAEAATRQPWVSSLRHTPVLLNPRLRFLLKEMTGASDRPALARKLAETFGDGDVQQRAAGADATGSIDKEQLARATGDVDSALRYLAHHAVLMPKAS